MTELSEHRDRLAASMADLIRPELDFNKVAGPYIVLASETDLTCHGWFWGMTGPRMARMFEKDMQNFEGADQMRSLRASNEKRDPEPVIATSQEMR